MLIFVMLLGCKSVGERTHIFRMKRFGNNLFERCCSVMGNSQLNMDNLHLSITRLDVHKTDTIWTSWTRHFGLLSDIIYRHVWREWNYHIIRWNQMLKFNSDIYTEYGQKYNI